MFSYHFDIKSSCSELIYAEDRFEPLHGHCKLDCTAVLLLRFDDGDAIRCRGRGENNCRRKKPTITDACIAQNIVEANALHWGTIERDTVELLHRLLGVRFPGECHLPGSTA